MGSVAAKNRNSLPAPIEEGREQFRSAFFHVAPSMFLGALDQTTTKLPNCLLTNAPASLKSG
ncbi:MAG: hypothetical protein JWM63_4975 [Gammaproteobacteria bacterium]|nr:hypothetical protein [Gammaproteobacteria bacterium]